MNAVSLNSKRPPRFTSLVHFVVYSSKILSSPSTAKEDRHSVKQTTSTVELFSYRFNNLKGMNPAAYLIMFSSSTISAGTSTELWESSVHWNEIWSQHTTSRLCAGKQVGLVWESLPYQKESTTSFWHHLFLIGGKCFKFFLFTLLERHGSSWYAAKEAFFIRFEANLSNRSNLGSSSLMAWMNYLTSTPLHIL